MNQQYNYKYINNNNPNTSSVSHHKYSQTPNQINNKKPLIDSFNNKIHNKELFNMNFTNKPKSNLNKSQIRQMFKSKGKSKSIHFLILITINTIKPFTFLYFPLLYLIFLYKNTLDISTSNVSFTQSFKQDSKINSNENDIKKSKREHSLSLSLSNSTNKLLTNLNRIISKTNNNSQSYINSNNSIKDDGRPGSKGQIINDASIISSNNNRPYSAPRKENFLLSNQIKTSKTSKTSQKSENFHQINSNSKEKSTINSNINNRFSQFSKIIKKNQKFTSSNLIVNTSKVKNNKFDLISEIERRLKSNITDNINDDNSQINLKNRISKSSQVKNRNNTDDKSKNDFITKRQVFSSIISSKSNQNKVKISKSYSKSNFMSNGIKNNRSMSFNSLSLNKESKGNNQNTHKKSNSSFKLPKNNKELSENMMKNHIKPKMANLNSHTSHNNSTYTNNPKKTHSKIGNFSNLQLNKQNNNNNHKYLFSLHNKSKLNTTKNEFLSKNIEMEFFDEPMPNKDLLINGNIYKNDKNQKNERTKSMNMFSYTFKKNKFHKDDDKNIDLNTSFERNSIGNDQINSHQPSNQISNSKFRENDTSPFSHHRFNYKDNNKKGISLNIDRLVYNQINLNNEKINQRKGIGKGIFIKNSNLYENSIEEYKKISYKEGKFIRESHNENEYTFQNDYENHNQNEGRRVVKVQSQSQSQSQTQGQGPIYNKIKIPQIIKMGKKERKEKKENETDKETFNSKQQLNNSSSSYIEDLFNSSTIKNLIKGPITNNKEKTVTCIVDFTRTGFQDDYEKSFNQDIAIIYKEFMGNKDYYFLSVCDGHGKYGHEVSDYIKNYLPYNLERELKSNQIDVFDYENKEKRNETIEKVFLTTNNSLNLSEIDTEFSGSTCVSMFMNKNKIITANIGDSRIVVGSLCNGGKF